MKVHLFDIETHLDPALLEEAHELTRGMQEYDINRIEDNFYHCISKQPDFHVEIRINDEGIASPRCHCATFKRTKKCKHAVASLLLLREFIQRGRRNKKKSNNEVMEEVLRKLNVSELRSFLASYASSHSALRAEILSNYLYLTKRPDYHGLFNDLAPIDKFGQIRLNRNNIKTVRAFSATLLKRAQGLLRDKALQETILIIEAVLFHLHRLWAKAPQFQDQISVELKMAYKLFESLCQQSMAPRLQPRTIMLAFEICGRDGYQFPAGARPLIQIAERFILEEKRRKEAFTLAQEKAISENAQKIKWIGLVFHWMRTWSIKLPKQTAAKLIEKNIADVVRDFYQQSAFEDILFTLGWMDESHPDPAARKGLLQAGLKAAKSIGDQKTFSKYAFELALHHLDNDAWEMLWESDQSQALRILKQIENLSAPGDDPATDKFLLHGWQIAGNGKSMLDRLRSINDINLLQEYDLYLHDKHKDAISDIYASYISSTREAFGGMMARQKLNNIFSRIKYLDLSELVGTKLKAMENPNTITNTMMNTNTNIKGFVFDLDGVIVDTAVHHFQSWKKILKELGAEIQEEDDHHTRGAGRMESLEYLLNRYHIDLTDEEKLSWAAKKNDVYIEAINEITPEDLLPGALPFMEASRKQGLMLALGSASKNARSVLDKLQIMDRFDAILDGNDAKASKPDPEIFIKACAALGLDPQQVVVFEDAPKGVQAALAAGCKVVGIGDISTLSEAHIVIPGLYHASPSQIIENLS